jgi:hypothetical protein
MGIDHNAYIGPYLRVTGTVEKREVDYCADHNRGDAAYCPQCGKSKKDRISVKEGNNAPGDWQGEYPKGEFYNYLSSTAHYSDPDIKDGKRTYIYIPNRYYKEMSIPSIEGGKYSEEEVDLEALNVAEMKKKFTKLFKDEIAYLKQWFEVEIKFGYISYCS